MTERAAIEAIAGQYPDREQGPGPCPRRVVCYTERGRIGHEAVTRSRIAEQIAGLLGCEAAGEYDAAHGAHGGLYFVPDRTLEREHAERRLGITSELDLFGGVVPHRHVATKVITHPLVGDEASAPAGWSPEFAARVATAVLRGYSTFSRPDARRAARELLDAGPVRIKRARETGGRGQFVARHAAEADRVLAELTDDDFVRDGVVLEMNLDAVRTLSVGQVRVGNLRATYYGEQRLTRDHQGAEVYGGSTLWIVRGDYDALLARELPPDIRTAIEQARRYDGAASEYVAGFYASRRNYDVAQGRDARGHPLSGVLEQSWRIGGASSAEVCALEAFASDPRLSRVRAACTELYGPCEVPPNAKLYFQGVDPCVGHITKYTTVEPL